MRQVRIAIVQLEIHPALSISHLSYLGEPFLRGPGRATLSSLGAKGVPVVDLQNFCRAEYLEWEQRRITNVLRHLEKLGSVPDLVLFSEGAIPDKLLPIVADWSKRHHSTVVAGSHTPNFGAQGRRRYLALGESSEHLNEIGKYESDNCISVLRRGGLTLIAKSALSVSEKSDLGALGSVPKPRLLPIETNAGKIQIVILNCAEALRDDAPVAGADLVAVVGFHRKPEDFNSWAARQVLNKGIVAVCNAGQYGGSRFHTAHDARMSNWCFDVFPDGLPSGNSILVGDIDLDVREVQVAVADPAQAFTLVQLSEVTAQNAPSARAASVLQKAANLHATPDQLLEVLTQLKGTAPSAISQRRADLLAASARDGATKESLCRQVGNDCIVAADGDLKQLEARLSSQCVLLFQTIMATHAATVPEDVLRQVVELFGECQARAGASAPTKGSTTRDSNDERDTLDRDAQIKKIDQFLKAGGAKVLTITGAPNVGKTSLWKKALRALGVQRIRTVVLSENPSPEFLAAATAGLRIEDAGITFPIDWCRRRLTDHLRGCDALVIQDAHNLLEYGRWKDPDLREVLHEVFEAAAAIGVKTIVESRRRTPEDDNPFLESAERIRVEGLDGVNAAYGVQLLERQLRRVDLSPEILSAQQKQTIVSRLSGHPKAIELAANVCLDEGPEELMRSMESGKGNIFARINRLAKLVALDRRESQVLGLLCRAREPVPRSVITASATTPSAEAIRDLIDTGFVEQDVRGWISIPDVFQPTFRALRPKEALVQQFHETAASQLAEYVRSTPNDLTAAVEANFHAGLAGKDAVVALPLPDALLGAAEQLYKSQQWDAAYRIVSTTLKATRSKQALRLGALIAARLRRLDEAVALAKECFGKDNQDFRLLAELGRIALTQYDDRLAQELSDIASAAGVEDAEVNILRGRLAMRRRDLKNAVVYFERAVEMTRHNPWAYLHLGKVYAKLGQVDNALEALHDGEQFFYDVNSRSANAIQAIKANIGLAYLQKGNVELATTYIQGIEVDERSPETAVAVAALAARTGGEGKGEAALALLRKAKFRDQFSRSLSHLMAGQVLLNMDEAQRANTEFEKALEVDRGNVHAMILWARSNYDLALDYRASGDEAYKGYARDALRLAKKAFEYDRDNREVGELLRDLEENFPETKNEP